MRTRRSPRNQERLFRALFTGPDAPKLPVKQNADESMTQEEHEASKAWRLRAAEEERANADAARAEWQRRTAR